MRDKYKNSEPLDLTDLVKSSVHDIEAFEKTSVYHDMQTIIQDWSIGLKSDYDSAETLDEFRFLQGVSMALDYVARLTEAMKTIASIKEEEDKNKREKES